MNEKAIAKAYGRFLASVWQDAMLAACMAAPILMGAAFRLGLPQLERFLCTQFRCAELLTPYYRLFDLLLSVMTPVMFAFAGVMTILEECDNGTARYLMVTPLGRAGYLISRLDIQIVLSVGYAAALLAVCGLSGMGGGMIWLVSLLNALLSGVISMLVVSLAHNKVEGMALVKLSSVLILGIPAVFFCAGPVELLLAVLPSYWAAKLAVTGQGWYQAGALLCTGLWGAGLWRHFAKKLI